MGTRLLVCSFKHHAFPPFHSHTVPTSAGNGTGLTTTCAQSVTSAATSGGSLILAALLE